MARKKAGAKKAKEQSLNQEASNTGPVAAKPVVKKEATLKDTANAKSKKQNCKSSRHLL